MRVRSRLAMLSLIAAVAFPKAAVAQFPTIDDIRAWVQEHHPKVMAGDTSVNYVLLVADANGRFVRSMATRLDASELAAIDSGFARLERVIATRQGAMRADTAWIQCLGRAPAAAVPARPLCIIDGARVAAFDGPRALAIADVVVLRGAAAGSYGADGANGVVAATTNVRTLERFGQLGVTAENFGSYMANRVRGGVVGPNRMDIMTIVLKDAKH